MTCFDVMTKCLTSWRVFDFMTNGLTSWRIFYFRTNFLTLHIFDITHFLHHDVFLTLWQTFGVMRNPLTSLRVFCMINFLILWCSNFLMEWWNFWYHNKLIDIMTCLWHYDNFLIYDKLLDVMTYVNCTYWRPSWRTFWRHIAFWHHTFLTSRHSFWPHH